MQPESEKNYLLAPAEVEVPADPLLACAPSAAGERMKRARPNSPRNACVKTTAVNSEAIVPTPRVKAKPLTSGGREREEDERRDQRDHVRVDDRRDAAAVAGGDRAQHRFAAPRLLLDSLEDDDVGVGRHPDSQDQPRDPRQRQGDRDQLDQGEEDQPVDRQRRRPRRTRGSGSRRAGRGRPGSARRSRPSGPGRAPAARGSPRPWSWRSASGRPAGRRSGGSVARSWDSCMREAAGDLGAGAAVDPVGVVDEVDDRPRLDLLVEDDREVARVGVGGLRVAGDARAERSAARAGRSPW